MVGYGCRLVKKNWSSSVEKREESALVVPRCDLFVLPFYAGRAEMSARGGNI